MKEIFDDIRNKASLCSDEACFMPDDTVVITENRLKQILDEEESKWEAELRKHDIEVRNKAIAEFAEKLKRIFRDIGAFTGYEVKREIDEIAEQLKEE